ncbi:unnamed protein product, partial [Hymenolepis diminuta]
MPMPPNRRSEQSKYFLLLRGHRRLNLFSCVKYLHPDEFLNVYNGSQRLREKSWHTQNRDFY